jgi:hypothetical protein
MDFQLVSLRVPQGLLVYLEFQAKRVKQDLLALQESRARKAKRAPLD